MNTPYEMKSNAIFLSGLFLIQSAFGQIPSIDASGRDGKDGVNGASHNTSPQYAGGGRGRDGSNGGDAGGSTSGQGAGDITVNIRDKELISGQTQAAIIEIDASILSANGHSQKYQNQFSTSSPGFMYLQAKGGKGGNGGIGGDGQGGQNGSSGSDATQFSSGTSGDSGGDGGDGGDGTPGSNGGKGGDIQVQLKSIDSHLSLMVAANVDGGEGGAAGQNGRGGSGGQGGSGGNSYSWTTQVFDGQDCSEIDNGNGSSTRSCTDRYRTEYHSKPGGSSGSSGFSGRSGNGNISAGRRASNGQFSFIVDDNGKKNVYTRPFSVRLRSYKIKDQNNDGITEPDETITIENLVVQNASEMPWNASKAQFLVFLENSGWIVAEPVELNVPSLAAGETTTLKGQLKFKVKQTNQFGNEKRWSSQDHIVPKNLVTRVNRTQEGFTLVKPITITFPLEVTPLVSKYSVGAGETQKILWKVKNISRQALGADSLSLRKVIQNIRFKKQSTQDVEFSLKNDEMPSLLDTDRLLEIALLRQGEEVLIEGEVTFAQDSLPYTDREFQLDLSQGKLNDPQKPQKIQEQNFRFKISQLYNYNKNADWILIVNNNTTREEFLAWSKLAEEFGIKMDVWDVSYYGKLVLSETMNQHENSFAKNYSRKTAIILNNSLQAGVDDAPQRPLDQVSQRDFVESMLQGGLNVVVIGPERNPMDVFEKLLVDSRTAARMSSAKELIKKVEVESAQTQFGILGAADVKTYSFFGEPDEHDLKENASGIAKKLLQLKPEERFIVSYNMDLHKLGWWKYGSTVKIQKTLSPVFGKLVVLNVDEKTLHQTEFIHSPENILSVLEGMNYGYKLKIFSTFKNENSPWSTFVADALIRDLIAEQDMAFKISLGQWETIKRTFRGIFIGEAFIQELDRKYQCIMGLTEKCKKKKELSPTTQAGSEFLRIVAAMKFYSTKILSWSNLVSVSQPTTLGSVLLHRRDMNRLADAVVANHYPKAKEAAYQNIKFHEENFEKMLVDRNKTLKGNSNLQNAQNMLKKSSIGATYSSDRLLKPENLVRKENR